MDTQTSPAFVPAAPNMETSPRAPAPVAVAATDPTPTTTTQGIEALKDITFGSLAGSIGKIVEYPFDTVKVRLQSQPDHLPLRYAGPLDCFRQGLRQDGFAGLYRGVSAPMFGAAAETACLFWSYRVAQDVLRATGLWGEEVVRGKKKEEEEKEGVVVGKEKMPMSALMTAGAMAGGVTSLVLTPIELVKCRVQAPSPSYAAAGGLEAAGQRQGSIFAVVADVYRHEGLRGFWRGQLGTLVREVGGGVAWFGSYEALTKYFKSRLRDPANESIPLWQQMTSGALAGMGYNFTFFPADTIKSKMQTGELTHVRPTFMNVGRELWRAHGLKGLYRGCGITVARSAPSSALIFTIYEYLRKAFE